MIRVLLLLILTAAAAPAQKAPSVPNPPSPAPTAPRPATPAELPPDAVVITVHGLCPANQAASTEASASCATRITKDELDTIVSAMSFNNPGQALTASAIRVYAENYVQALILADAAEKAGLTQDPRFQELMKIVRLRILGDAWRHSLQERFGKPTSAEIEAFYKQYPGKFEQVALDRIFLPKFNPKAPRENAAEFERRARQAAGEVRDRAARGEDMAKLQAEAYKSLGLTPPLSTDLGTRRKGSLQAASEEAIASLKAGEVSKVVAESSGFSVYKVRGRGPLALDQVKGEIVREIYQKKMDDALQAVQGRVHADFEERFFGPKGTKQVPPAPKPVRTP